MIDHPLGNRTPYPMLLALTMVLGLASRHMPMSFPAWLIKDPGDILYATMVYWFLRLFMPTAAARIPAASAVAICFVIEFSKLSHLAWLSAIRHTHIGQITLGVGFHVSNLVCYVLGVAIAMIIEAAIKRKRQTVA